MTLLLLSDSPLIDQLARRELGALAGLTPARRRRLTETFGAWLETRRDAGMVAQRLRIHPQTVRYRVHKIEQILADQLEDPDARFAMEIVLRAMRLKDWAHRPRP